GAGERGLGGGEQGRDGQEAEDDRGEGQDVGHQAAPSSLRKSDTAAASTSLAMKASPSPRARMKVSRPACAFLSCAMWPTRRAASNGWPGISASVVGRP